jgi:hypothetical protein
MVTVHSEGHEDYSIGIEWDQVSEYPKLKEALERAVQESRAEHFENQENDPYNDYEEVCIQQHPIQVTDSQATLNLNPHELYFLGRWLAARSNRSQEIVESNRLI